MRTRISLSALPKKNMLANETIVQLNALTQRTIFARESKRNDFVG